MRVLVRSKRALSWEQGKQGRRAHGVEEVEGYYCRCLDVEMDFRREKQTPTASIKPAQGSYGRVIRAVRCEACCAAVNDYFFPSTIIPGIVWQTEKQFTIFRFSVQGPPSIFISLC